MAAPTPAVVSIADKDSLVAKPADESGAKPVVSPENTSATEQPTDLLAERSECSIGLTTAECKRRTDKTVEEMRDEAYDKLANQIFPNRRNSKAGRLRLKKDRVEWQLKF